MGVTMHRRRGKVWDLAGVSSHLASGGRHALSGYLARPLVWEAFLCQTVFDRQTTEEGKTMTDTTRTPADVLADAMRAAITASHESGYRSGRYVSDQSTEEEVLRDARDAAQVREGTATRAMWNAFYEAMATPVPEAPRTCWCGQRATWRQSIDPEVTSWDEVTKTSDGQPAAYRCDEHTGDSFGAAEAI